MAGKRVRESWEKYGPRGRQVESFVGLMDSMSHEQWVVVGETEKNHDFDEYGEALDEWRKVSVSAAVSRALSSLGTYYQPNYDRGAVERYTRGGIRDAVSVAPDIIGIADRLPTWAVEVLLRSFVRAGVDLSSVLPEGMDVSHPLPHNDDSPGEECVG